MIYIDLKTKTIIQNPRVPLSLALGNFDGVHVGHCELIKATIAKKNELKAKYSNICAAVWTFESLTHDHLRNGTVPHLTTMDEKLEIFADLGLDYAIFADFLQLKDYSPKKFVNEVLIEQCNAVNAVCGFNFRFGTKGSGDSDALISLMSESKLSTIVVPPVLKNGHIVSATAIRLFIENGAIEQANDYLGRAFSINLPVVQGRQFGRKIGLPTINQNFPSMHIVPKKGIYAVTCDVEGSTYLGITNIGTSPTVTDTIVINSETHIINYSGMLYGKTIKVSFYTRLRDEQKFASIEDLKTAIEKDKANAIDYFSLK